MLSTVLIIDKRKELSVKYKKSIDDSMIEAVIARTLKEAFLQIQKLDDMIAKAMISAAKNGGSAEIKALLDAKKNISATISQLAEQNCISLKHNKNNTNQS